MKRIIDIIISVVLIIITSPLFFLISVIIKHQMRGEVIFKQLRPGLYCKPFYLYKFRTMTNEKDGTGNLLPDEKRITKCGAILRKFSFDELPQLINVLKGELSLVGPRPLLMKYLPLYTLEQIRRHNVKPGITGWAQVNGRNAITWEQKFELDIWYVNNHSIWLDCKILYMTAGQVIRRKGINHMGYTTMPEFLGSSQ